MTSRPAALDVDPAQFFGIPRAFGPSFSSDGARVAFVSTSVEAGSAQAFAVALCDGPDVQPVQLTSGEHRVGLVAFAPLGDRLILGADIGGDEQVQLFLLADLREPMRALTSDAGAIHSFGGFSPDGRRIAYAMNGRDRRFFDVHVMDLDSGSARCVVETDGLTSVAGFSPNGARLVISRAEGTLDQRLLEVDIDSGAIRLLTPHEGCARYRSPVHAPSGKSVYLLTDHASDVLVLARLDLATLAIETVAAGDWDIESFALAPDGRRVAYAINIDGVSELRILDLETGRVQEIATPPGMITSHAIDAWRDAIVWSPDGEAVAFTLSAPGSPTAVWIAETRGGVARLLIPAKPAAPERQVRAPRLIRYESFDGLAIPALLYLPEGAKPDGVGAAIVRFHGGPTEQARPVFSAEIAFLVQLGYVVLAPNVRGSSGYGKRWLALDDVGLRMNAVADGKAAADWLAREGWAHPQKIAAMGASYGGFMVLANMCTYPETWAAGVDLFGQANWVTFLEGTHPMRRRHREAEYGSLEHDRALLERISPIHSAHRIQAPLFAVHGENDPRVPIGETEQIVSALLRRGVPVELMRLAEEGHGVTKRANRVAVFAAITRFLGRYLG